MLNTLDRFKQWCRDWWVGDICAEGPMELDLENWLSTEYCGFHKRENAEECDAVVQLDVRNAKANSATLA